MLQNTGGIPLCLQNRRKGKKRYNGLIRNFVLQYKNSGTKTDSGVASL